MVTWECNRCGLKASDLGARISKVPLNWNAYILTEVDGSDTLGYTIEIVHLCAHCVSVGRTTKSNNCKIEFEHRL